MSYSYDHYLSYATTLLLADLRQIEDLPSVVETLGHRRGYSDLEAEFSDTILRIAKDVCPHSNNHVLSVLNSQPSIGDIDPSEDHFLCNAPYSTFDYIRASIVTSLVEDLTSNFSSSVDLILEEIEQNSSED